MSYKITIEGEDTKQIFNVNKDEFEKIENSLLNIEPKNKVK